MTRLGQSGFFDSVEAEGMGAEQPGSDGADPDLDPVVSQLDNARVLQRTSY